MANVVAIMGKSGGGKTTSARTLDSKQTVYVDCDKKGLSWKGWKSAYNKENRNYVQSSDVATIQNTLAAISNNPKLAHIENVIIDTINGVMLDIEMNRRREKSFDKWMDIAADVYELVRDSHLLRENLNIFFMCHVQDVSDDSGNHQYSILTNGRKLEKIHLESKFTTVLFAKALQGKYIFETQASNSTAKSPMGMFDDFEIPNDLNYVVSKIKEFNS
jgi:hypothetical protein